jgi:hypothetical protein
MEAKARQLPSLGAMREAVTVEKVRRLMHALGKDLREETRVYLVGGSSAVLCGWRQSTIDVDLHVEPDGEIYAAIARIKEDLCVNVELASPRDFLPQLPGWQERSPFIGREGKTTFFHFDFYSQALAKVERGFERDMEDVREMVQRGLVVPTKALDLFSAIEPELVRFPAIDPSSLRAAVRDAFESKSDSNCP